MSKGIRAPTPHHTTSGAAAPTDMVHIDTAGAFQKSLGGSRYVVMFVDSASRFQRPYGTRDKSASAIFDVVQRFGADMGVPRAFRTDNGAEYTNSTFVDYCNSLRICREMTGPNTSQQNGPVESGLSRAIKAGHAARIEVNRLFPDVHLERLTRVRDPDGSSLWIESVLWVSEEFNRSATTANSGILSPHEVFFGGRPPIPVLPVLPFCKPAYHRVPRHSKMYRQACPCFLLNFGYNHGSDCFKVMDAETERIVHSRDVTWHQPREPLISPASTVGLAVPQSSSGAETPDYVHVQPAPGATAAPTAAPVPASANAAPAPLQPPPPQFPIAFFGNWGTRPTCVCLVALETKRARWGNLPTAWVYVPCRIGAGMVTREAFDKAFREHELPPPDADLPTDPTSDVPILSTIAEAESSEHAEI